MPTNHVHSRSVRAAADRACRGRVALHRRRQTRSSTRRRRRGGQYRAGARGNRQDRRATIAKLNYIVPVWTSPERERLVDRLARWTPPGLTRFFFTSGGSEAVEAALKFAMLYHKVHGKPSKKKIIARRVLLSRQYASPRSRPAAVCAAPTTSTCCSIGRRSIPRIATDARGARPIRRAISIAPMRSKKKSKATATTRSRRSSPSR